MLKTYDIALDIEKELYKISDLLFSVSRLDLDSVQLNFTITQDDKAFNLTGTTLELAIKKPSGLTVYTLCEISDALNGKARILLPLQSYIEYGVYTAEIYIRDVDQLLVTSPFYYQSRSAIMTQEEESVNDWSALQNALFAYDKKPFIVTSFPSISPEYVGQMAYNTTDNVAYISNGTSWAVLGGGEGGGGTNDTIVATGAPTITPVRLGQLYIDSLNKIAYISTGEILGDWEQIDNEGVAEASITWNDVTEKPLVFPPEDHTHSYTDLTNVPTTFTPSTHSHSYTELTNVPTTFTPEAHTHSYTELTNVPTTFTPSAHSHSYTELTDVPLTFTPSTHSHSYTELTDVPLTFTPPEEYLTQTEGDDRYALKGTDGGTVQPVAWGQITGTLVDQTDLNTALIGKSDDGHTHSYTELTDVPLTFTPSTHSHSYTELTNVPTTFTPEAHDHIISDITNLETTLNELDKKPVLGNGAPTVTPEYISQMYLDQTSGEAYIANGATSADWVLITNQNGESSVAWGQITGTLASQTDLQDALNGKSDDGHTHSYTTLTDVPTTFTPEAHTHSYTTLTDVPLTFTPEAHTHSYTTLTDVPTSFTPSAHEHTKAEITDFAHTHTEADLTFGAKNAKTYVDDADNYILNTVLDGLKLWSGTQTEYDALTPDATTLYFITGA